MRVCESDSPDTGSIRRRSSRPSPRVPRHRRGLDPHSAIGWLAGTAEQGGRPMVSVATAHPAKFPDAVWRATGIAPSSPTTLADLADRPRRTRTVPADLSAVAAILSSCLGPENGYHPPHRCDTSPSQVFPAGSIPDRTQDHTHRVHVAHVPEWNTLELSRRSRRPSDPVPVGREEHMSTRAQLQSKSVGELREIAKAVGIEADGLQKAKIITALVEAGEAAEGARRPRRTSNCPSPRRRSDDDSRATRTASTERDDRETATERRRDGNRRQSDGQRNESGQSQRPRASSARTRDPDSDQGNQQGGHRRRRRQPGKPQEPEPQASAKRWRSGGGQR
jgi:hypothetical protein